MKPKSLSKELIGKRVKLVPLNKVFAPQIFNIVKKERLRLSEFLPWVEANKSIKDTLNYIELENDSQDLYDFCLFKLSDKKYIGNIGVHSISWENECCELGYWLSHEFEGQGFMSEAVNILSDHLFSEGFHRIEVRMGDKNMRSQNIPRNLGFVYEGTLKQNRRLDNQFRDTLVFAKIKA